MSQGYVYTDIAFIKVIIGLSYTGLLIQYDHIVIMCIYYIDSYHYKVVMLYKVLGKMSRCDKGFLRYIRVIRV